VGGKKTDGTHCKEEAFQTGKHTLENAMSGSGQSVKIKKKICLVRERRAAQGERDLENQNKIKDLIP